MRSKGEGSGIVFSNPLLRLISNWTLISFSSIGRGEKMHLFKLMFQIIFKIAQNSILFILLHREIFAHLEFSLNFLFSLVHRSCILCSLFCIFLMSYYTSLRFLTQLHIHTVLCIKCVLWELQKSLNDEYGELQSLHLVCFLIYQWNCSPMNLCFTAVIFEI